MRENKLNNRDIYIDNDDEVEGSGSRGEVSVAVYLGLIFPLVIFHNQIKVSSVRGTAESLYPSEKKYPTQVKLTSASEVFHLSFDVIASTAISHNPIFFSLFPRSTLVTFCL